MRGRHGFGIEMTKERRKQEWKERKKIEKCIKMNVSGILVLGQNMLGL